jgi:hypothetical protein
MGNEGLENMAFLFMIFGPVKMKEIVQSQAMGTGHHAIHINIFL